MGKDPRLPVLRVLEKTTGIPMKKCGMAYFIGLRGNDDYY